MYSLLRDVKFLPSQDPKSDSGFEEGGVKTPIPKEMVNGASWDGTCTRKNPCKACEGDCDSDAECGFGLKCFQRSSSKPSDIPGCPAEGQKPGWDYCYDPYYGVKEVDLQGEGNYPYIDLHRNTDLRQVSSRRCLLACLRTCQRAEKCVGSR